MGLKLLRLPYFSPSNQYFAYNILSEPTQYI
jgi:hypothetical protein